MDYQVSGSIDMMRRLRDLQIVLAIEMVVLIAGETGIAMVSRVC